MNLFSLIALLAIICILSTASISCSQLKAAEKEKQTMRKLKHAKPSLKACNANFEKGFHPELETRLFLATESKDTLVSKQSVFDLYQTYKNECNTQDEFTVLNRTIVELKWRYQFLESAHCIRIELDLGNVTRLKTLFNYSYYMFSYRELSRRNTHVKRQPIVDQLNTLTIHRVNIRPYIVCVTFYKSVELNYTKPSANESSSDDQVRFLKTQ